MAAQTPSDRKTVEVRTYNQSADRFTHRKNANESQIAGRLQLAITRVERRVVRRRARDRPPSSRPRGGAARAKRSVCRRQTASAGRNSKRLAPQECAILARTFQILLGAGGNPRSGLWTGPASGLGNRIW